MSVAGWSRQGTVAIDAAVVIGLAGLPLALVAGRPELVIVAAPLVLAAVLTFALASTPDVDVEMVVGAERLLEGGDPGVGISVRSADTATVVVDLTITDPSGTHHRRAGFAVSPGEPAVVDLELDSSRWGARDVRLDMVTVDRSLGLVRHQRSLTSGARVRVLPSSQRLRTILAPDRTRPTLGNLPSRATGGGLEFAGTRPYRTGDDHRWINWRSSARRGELWVNEYHVERSADVVLFLDSFRDVRYPTDDDSSAIVAVRLADTLARSYLREQARVGAVSFGSGVRWLRLGMGRRQAFQIVDTLIDAEASQRARRLRTATLPPRQIPTEALVIVISPLLDHRIITAVAGLRARDHDVVVIDLGTAFDIVVDTNDVDRRLLRLGRSEALGQLASIGVPVGSWADGRPLEAVLAQIDRWRGRVVSRR